MSDMMNWLLAVVQTGDEANPTKWIWIMVVVGILLAGLAVVSVVMGKKQTGSDKKEEKKETETSDEKDE